jgi:hypothetical protein
MEGLENKTKRKRSEIGYVFIGIDNTNWMTYEREKKRM